MTGKGEEMRGGEGKSTAKEGERDKKGKCRRRPKERKSR